VWRRLATDLRPRHLDSIRQVRSFAELPQVIDDVIAGRNRGRAVIALED
jgi:alcohol dehydrogenase